MNETRGNSRTKPMRGGLKGGEINSLKDSEKTNEYKFIPKDEKDCLYCKYSYADDLYLEMRCKLHKTTCPSEIKINKKGQQTYKNPICKNFIHD